MIRKMLENLLNNDVTENPWNPFISTKRDIQRTDDIASKNAVLAGVMTFLFIPAGLLYLNRGINTLKILGYVFTVSFVCSLVGKDNTKALSNLVGLVGAGAITAEQVMTVNKAQQKRQGISISSSTYISEHSNRNSPSFGTNKETVKLLKLLKEKFEANEISEEEFKNEKQRILNSM